MQSLLVFSLLIISAESHELTGNSGWVGKTCDGYDCCKVGGSHIYDDTLDGMEKCLKDNECGGCYSYTMNGAKNLCCRGGYVNAVRSGKCGYVFPEKRSLSVDEQRRLDPCTNPCEAYMERAWKNGITDCDYRHLCANEVNFCDYHKDQCLDVCKVYFHDGKKMKDVDCNEVCEGAWTDQTQSLSTEFQSVLEDSQQNSSAEKSVAPLAQGDSDLVTQLPDVTQHAKMSPCELKCREVFRTAWQAAGTSIPFGWMCGPSDMLPGASDLCHTDNCYDVCKDYLTAQPEKQVKHEHIDYICTNSCVYSPATEPSAKQTDNEALVPGAAPEPDAQKVVVGGKLFPIQDYDCAFFQKCLQKQHHVLKSIDVRGKAWKIQNCLAACDKEELCSGVDIHSDAELDGKIYFNGVMDTCNLLQTLKYDRVPDCPVNSHWMSCRSKHYPNSKQVVIV